MKIIFKSIFVILLLLSMMGDLRRNQLYAQAEIQNQKQEETTPESIQYTTRMGRAIKDMEWSNTYYKSYLQTREPSYLRLAAQFCGKAIINLAETQELLSRTTSFYNRVDQKRLQACRFYDKLQKKSFLLTSDHYLPDSSAVCK